MKRKICFLLLLLMSLSLIGSQVRAATVFLEPHGDLPTLYGFELTVDPTELFLLDVYISVPEAQEHAGFYGAGFYIGFDGGVIRADAANVADPPFDSGWSVIDIGSDYVMYQAMMSTEEKNYYGDILMGTIQFSPIAMGTSMITSRDYSDFPDFVYFDGGTFDDEVTFCGGTVNVVPIPGTVLLFGSGLLGLMGIGRRRMKKS
ncbi:MAG: hypothetical protein BBJ60_02875 [Desulfobacterales bacterium S7086C20]|nr:MAG: hypothetical protein BBJ60_02875 [Desulfobacterales bacterium S7086C20]